MNRDERLNLLVESLNEAAIKVKEEQDQAAQIARVTALVAAKLAEKKAETSKPMSCPHCGEPLPESWRTDDVTSDSDSNDDPDNGDDDDDNYDNRKLTPLQRALKSKGIDPFAED